MKKRMMLMVMAIFLTLFVTSCISTIVTPVTATGNTIGSKVGIAKVSEVYIFGKGFPDIKTWEVADGVYVADIGIATAAKNGGITKIATVDQRITKAPFKRTIEIIVTGE